MQHKKNEMPNFEIIIIDRCMDIFILKYCILICKISFLERLSKT